jgi:hypothetical protein
MTSYKRLYQEERSRNQQLQDKLVWALDQLKQTGQPIGDSGEDAALRAIHARNIQIRHRSPQRPQT